MLLRDEDQKIVRNRLADLQQSVRLHFFTQQLAGACQFCLETEQLLKQLAGLSEKISLETHNFITDRETVAAYSIDKIPATAVEADKDTGIRLYGIPSGYEFATLLEILLCVSKRDSGLPPDLREKTRSITVPVHLQVFVTPTCPYCPKPALTACRMALENGLVTAEIVEITEFPHLAQKYSVAGVPKTVINGTASFEGAVPESLFIEQVVDAASQKHPDAGEEIRSTS
jgi:glutaredoxin-like protein